MTKLDVTNLMGQRIILARFRMTIVYDYKARTAFAQRSGRPAFSCFYREVIDIFRPDAWNIGRCPDRDS